LRQKEKEASISKKEGRDAKKFFGGDQFPHPAENEGKPALRKES